MLIRETLKFAAALAAVAAVTAWTAPANAVLMVTMQDELGATFHCVDNGGACDFSGAADSLLTLNNAVGSFQVTGTISTSQTGLLNLLSLVNFGAINNDTAAHTLNMYVSDTDFLGPVSGIASSAGILFSNAVGSGPSSLEFYADTGNTQGANLINFPGVLLASAVQTPTTNPQQFLGNDFAAFSDPNLFSMTQVAHINLRGGGSFTDFGMNMQNVNAVPVPAALPLLGSVVAGFGAFGAWRRRKLSGGSTAH
jgi:hypothetical protein